MQKLDGTDPCTISGSALWCSAAGRSLHTHRTGPSRFLCCCSIHLELSIGLHSTVRKHSHFQAPLKNASVQTHAALSASVSSDLKALSNSLLLLLLLLLLS